MPGPAMKWGEKPWVANWKQKQKPEARIGDAGARFTWRIVGFDSPKTGFWEISGEGEALASVQGLRAKMEK